MNPPGRAPLPPDPGPGLRLRIWVGCLGAALVVALALWLVISRSPVAVDALGSELVWVWLPAIGGAGVLIGIALALWLTHGIATPLAGLARGVASGQFTDLRGLPSGSGWGEVSHLLQQVQMLLARQRQLSRSAAELDLLHQQIERMGEPLARWTRTGRFESVEPEVGPLRALALALQRGIARAEERSAESGALAAELRSQRSSALSDARDTAVQAEGAFVEATSLLTTVRELQRLSGELRQVLGAAGSGAPDAAEAYERYRAAAAEAIEELVSASTESVGHLAHSMLRVSEISDQVHLVANRATLIALDAAASARAVERGARPESDVGEGFKQLAREVRAATDRATALTREIETDVAAARTRMQDVRSRVAEALDRAGGVPAAGAAPSLDDAARLLDRVREMVQDATLKGERLSASGERASRAAESLTRRLEEEARVLERLTERTAESEAPAHESETGSRSETPPPGATPRTLRLLGREDLERGEPGREERR